jgi:hypothetical protein
MVVVEVCTRPVIRFAVAAANLDGSAFCQMFDCSIAKQRTPQCLNSANDPRFQFQWWRVNLGILEVAQIKAMPLPRARILSLRG